MGAFRSCFDSNNSTTERRFFNPPFFVHNKHEGPQGTGVGGTENVPGTSVPGNGEQRPHIMLVSAAPRWWRRGWDSVKHFGVCLCCINKGSTTTSHGGGGASGVVNGNVAGLSVTGNGEQGSQVPMHCTPMWWKNCWPH